MASQARLHRSMVLESDVPAINELCETIVTELHAHNFNEDAVFGVHLAVNEALINACNHGNRMDPKKSITIEYSIDPEKIEISVADEGKGFDPNAIPDPRLPVNIYRGMGRGVLLMRAYMNVVEYNELGNRVRMVHYKGKQPKALAR